MSASGPSAESASGCFKQFQCARGRRYAPNHQVETVQLDDVGVLRQAEARSKTAGGDKVALTRRR
eukprot:1973230-Alexandrium_andersonii.AAC.1